MHSLDPLSAYLPKDLVAAYTSRTGQEAGPGIVVLKRYASFPQVVAVAEKSPAEAAGIKPGDVLSAVGGRSALSMSLTEVKLRLRGTDGQPIDLRVLEGNDSKNLKVPLAAIHPAPFTYTRAAGRPARLRIHRFDAVSSPGSSAMSYRRSRTARILSSSTSATARTARSRRPPGSSTCSSRSRALALTTALIATWADLVVERYGYSPG